MKTGYVQLLPVLALVLASPISGHTTTDAAVEVLRVTSYADDGSTGTLRAAILASNGAPGRYRIEVAPIGPQPHVIRLASALPPIAGPVQIEGADWRRTGEYVAIDGSGYLTGPTEQACPGAVAGQYGTNVRTTSNPGFQITDTAGVEVSGLELRHFCIGILLHRASDVSIHDNRFTANRGGAGVLITGDDGRGNVTAGTTVRNRLQRNEFVDNGDGLELTRGAAFCLVSDNVFRSTPANPEPSQGIEILRGSDNTIVRNRFDGYSDGIQINWGDRNYIAANVFTNNTIGVSATGVGNVIAGNTITGNGIGVAVRPASPQTVVRITENVISGNGRAISRCFVGGSCSPSVKRGGIVFNVPGAEHAEYVGARGGGVVPDPATLLYICPDHAPDCQGPPNGGIEPPRLTQARRASGHLTVGGAFTGESNQRYVIEAFGNGEAKSSEGEVFLGRLVIQTDARGQSTFSVSVDLPRAPPVLSVVATATSAEGATSEFSGSLPVGGAVAASKKD